jgi:adhesin/invasin
MTPLSGNAQTAPPLTALANPLVLKVLDAAGYPVPGVTVGFADNGAGGTFAATSLVTSSSGTVSAQYKTGRKSGRITITATSPGVKSTNVFATCVAAAATSIGVVSGGNQSAAAGTKLAKALTVVVKDVYGNPVSGNSVLFSDGGAGGAFSSPDPVATGTNGTAALFYTLPSSAKNITVTATATGVSAPAIFAETAH